MCRPLSSGTSAYKPLYLLNASVLYPMSHKYLHDRCDPATDDRQQAPSATKAFPRLGSASGAGNTSAAVTAGASAGHARGYQVSVFQQI